VPASDLCDMADGVWERGGGGCPSGAVPVVMAELDPGWWTWE